MDSRTEPSELRKLVLTARKQIPIDERAKKFLLILRNLRKIPAYKESANIIGYYGKTESGEFDTEVLLREILEQGQNLFLPRCMDNKVNLEIYKISNLQDDIEVGKYGIMEPKKTCLKKTNHSFDLIFVPGSVFDIRGARYGYGAGYYDEFLGDRKILKIALALEQCVMQFPISTHPKDVFMDIVVTEKNTYYTSKKNVIT